jgi:hypothetical protein
VREEAHLHDVAGAPGDAAEVDGPGIHGVVAPEPYRGEGAAAREGAGESPALPWRRSWSRQQERGERSPLRKRWRLRSEGSGRAGAGAGCGGGSFGGDDGHGGLTICLLDLVTWRTGAAGLPFWAFLYIFFLFRACLYG